MLAAAATPIPAPTQSSKSSLIVLDYNTLALPPTHPDSLALQSQLSSAFGNGPECLGACVVKNVPGYVEMRAKLLKLASTLANLSDEAKRRAEHPESSYLFGWSHGKEIMNGKPDFAKGSFYNNPVYDTVQVADREKFAKEFPEYGHDNKWVEEIPELKAAFMELGTLIVKTGQLVARHCDAFLSKIHPDLPAHFLESAIAESRTAKARLLHYFPQTTPTAADGPADSWCGLHIDHSMLTGLTSAMYMDETDPSSPRPLDSLPPTDSPSPGLYIKTRSGEFTHVAIPADCLAFQIGEAAQVASRGVLVATPHLVRGADPVPGLVLTRNTFAVFMQPNVDHPLKEGMTFHQFTQEVMKRHYADRM
ncbi:hypothetical protein DFS34DRAFT_487814 [Phlyctochytrium arcticum]|nr:hypothetical protein DFS34DRAFT_487814 [Phlyctochytrium arcticum]